MSRLKILSLNVRGLGSPTKSCQIVHELSFSKCDIALLHATYVSCKKQADKFEKLWNGNCFWSLGTGKSAGVTVLFSPNFFGKVIPFLYDSDSRILSLLIACNHFKLNGIFIHRVPVLIINLSSLVYMNILFCKVISLSAVISIVLTMFWRSSIVLLFPPLTEILFVCS